MFYLLIYMNQSYCIFIITEKTFPSNSFPSKSYILIFNNVAIKAFETIKDVNEEICIIIYVQSFDLFPLCKINFQFLLNLIPSKSLINIRIIFF